MDPKATFSTPRLAGGSLLLVVAPYYRVISDQLVIGARRVIAAAEARCDLIEVPGAFEIPPAIAWHGAKYDGYVALGCVVRGETSHYDYVCGESARALMELGVQRKIPVGLGILTVETLQQAEVRADPAGRDKGGEAARACLALAALQRSLSAS